MHDLRHDYTSRKISPWGCIKFFYKTYLQSGIRDCLLQADLPQKGSNRGYESIDLVEGFMTSVVLGSRRLAHSECIRQDEVIREIFGWERGMGCASSFSRFFSKFSVDRNNEVFPTIMKSWFESMAVKKMTIDIDSTVITRYGKQEEACVGYNPTKPGRVVYSDDIDPLFREVDPAKSVFPSTGQFLDCRNSRLLHVPGRAVRFIRLKIWASSLRYGGSSSLTENNLSYSSIRNWFNRDYISSDEEHEEPC
ncbi:MAG: transposase, partial [Bacteroidota bacterium]